MTCYPDLWRTVRKQDYNSHTHDMEQAHGLSSGGQEHGARL